MFTMRKSRAALTIHTYMWMSGKRSWRKWKRAPSVIWGCYLKRVFTGRYPGKFVEGTTHLKRRKESGRKPVHLGGDIGCYCLADILVVCNKYRNHLI